MLSTTNVSRARELNVTAPGAGDGPPSISPGPIYLPKHLGATGPQALSCIATQPRVLIGTAPRFPSSRSSAAGPGPAAHQHKGAPRANAPAYSMRARELFGSQLARSGRVPGPGAHMRLETSQTIRVNAPSFSLRPRLAPDSSLVEPTPAPGHSQHIRPSDAPQVLSTKPSLPGVRFTRASREDALAARSSTSAEVGPGAYADGDVTLLTGYRKGPRYTMGARTAPRRTTVADAALAVLPPALGKQVVSTLRSAPAFSLGGRTPFCGYAQGGD